MAKIDYGAVRDQLNMPDLTDEAVKSVLAKNGITTQAGADAWAKQNAAPAQPGFFAKGLEGLKEHWEKSEKPVTGIADWLGSSLTKPSEPAKKKVAAKPTETAAQKQAQVLAQQKEQAKAVESSPWTQAANALAQSFENDLTAVAPDMSGASIPGAQQSAASQAAGDLGLASQSPGAAWLAQGAADAQAQTKGVAGAMAAEGQTYANADQSIANAVRQWGQGNALGVQTAAEDTWLAALASHAQSNVNYYGGVAPSQIPELEQMPTVIKAFQQAGGGTQGSGLTPLSDFTVSPTGQVNLQKAGKNLAGTTPSTGSIPAPSPAP